MSESADKARAIAEAALALAPEQRQAHLEEACAGNAELRDQVETLLITYDHPELLPPTSGPTIAPGPSAGEKPGDLIGSYKLLEKIGEGGFGVVYVAEQRQPVKRRVALKIIKLGMDTRQVVARFEAERQALAMMDHPNIAKVLEAGALDNGRPYFVMELVRGIKITDYCDQNKLSTGQRLDLFVQICQAIEHAHHKGVIHRDIKPSNILVTLHDGVPVPKVIDFGIAKAMHGELTDKTVYTQLQQFVGTPAYMSPEQAEMSGLDVDAGTDIYSLGVLLYELLTGKTPFDQRQLLDAGLEEMRRMIRERDPLRPSTRLSTMVEGELTATASRRQAAPPKLVHLVRGDLDWIVMKCLEKDRTRRYETANTLAADVRRHLKHEPVLACPPSPAYRFRKLMRRRGGVFMAAGAVGALAIGLLLTIWSFGKERQAKAALEKLAKASLGASRQGGTPAEIVLRPPPWVDGEEMRLDIRVYGVTAASERDNVRSDHMNGKNAWRLGSRVSGSFSVVEVEADTLKPLHSRWEFSGSGDVTDVDTTYGPEHATLRSRAKAEVKKLDLVGPVFDNQEFVQLVRRLPLAPGYKVVLPLLVSISSSVLSVKLEVLGTETVTVPSGTYPCFKVGLSINQTFWYSSDPHRYLVKYEAGLVSAELTAVRHPTLAESIEELINERTVAAVDEAQYLAAGQSGLLARVSQAHEVLGLEKQAGDLLRKGEPATAEVKYREALAASRKHWPADPGRWEIDVKGLTAVLGQEGKYNDVDKVFNELFTLETRNQSPYTNLLELHGSFLASRGRWKEAAAAYSKLVEFQPDNHWQYHRLAPLLVRSGDLEGYRSLCARILTRFRRTDNPTVAERMAKACLILPDSGVDLGAVAAWAETAVTKGQANSGFLPYYNFAKSLAEYRAGRYASAAEWSRQVLPAVGGSYSLEADARMVLSMAQYRLGQTEDARRTLNTGIEIIEARLPKLDSGDNGGDPTDPIIAHALMREAKELIK